MCLGRHLVPVLTTCARRRWSYAQRVQGVGVSYIAKASTVMAHQASQNLNDIRRAALAYTFLRNVCAHSCENLNDIEGAAVANADVSKVLAHSWAVDAITVR